MSLQRHLSLYNGVSERSRGWKSRRTDPATDEQLPNNSSIMRWDGAARSSIPWDCLKKVNPFSYLRDSKCLFAAWHVLTDTNRIPSYGTRPVIAMSTCVGRANHAEAQRSMCHLQRSKKQIASLCWTGSCRMSPRWLSRRPPNLVVAPSRAIGYLVSSCTSRHHPTQTSNRPTATTWQLGISLHLSLEGPLSVSTLARRLST